MDSRPIHTQNLQSRTVNDQDFGINDVQLNFETYTVFTE